MGGRNSPVAHEGDNQWPRNDQLASEPDHGNAQIQEKSARHVTWQFPAQVAAPLNGRSNKASSGRQQSYQRLDDSSHRFWNPVWLSGPCFLLFATWYTLLGIGTLVVYLLSTRNSGIAEQSYNNRYTWTYGPTAVLVITTALWFHVDFWCKELTPWQRMRNKATRASDGILRDYFSSYSLVTIWTAIRKGDHGVWLSSCGTICLELAAIVSTALIILESSAVVTSTSFTVPESFVATSPNLTLQALSGNALVRYFGVDARNLSYPSGTSANLTIQSFVPASTYPQNSTFDATVNGAAASLECEPIQPTNLTRTIYQPWESIQAPFFSTNISVPSCTILGVTVGMGLDHNPPRVNTLASFQGWWNNYTCNDGILNDQYPEVALPSLPGRPSVPGYDDHRVVFITSYVQWTPINGMNITRHTWVQNFTGVICKPRYSVDTYDVQMSPKDANTRVPFQAQIRKGTSHKIDGVADIDLVSLVKKDSMHSLIIDSSLQAQVAVVTSDRGYLRPEDPLFIAMSRDGDTSKLSSLQTMMQRVPEVFSGVMSQAFQEYLTIPDVQEIEGTVAVFENRLKVKPLAVGWLLACLILLVSFSVALMFFSPVDCVPGDPGSIVAKAKLLTASPALSYHLGAVNGLNSQQVQARLDDKRYRSALGPQNSEFAIVPDFEPSMPSTERFSLVQEAPNVWWRPLNHRIWFIVVIIVSPLAIIGILEGLQHISDTQDGIRGAPKTGSRQVLINLIPALILGVLALTFQSMHVNACLIAPFNALKHGNVPHARGMTESLAGKTPPHVIILAIKNRLALPCITALCVVIGAFLTIVVSGLYYVDNVPATQTVALTRLDGYNFTSHDLSLADGLAGVTTKLFYKENLNYPRLTYGNLVFPDVDLVNATLAINGSSISAQLPAIRSTLRCFPNNASDVTYDAIIRLEGDGESELTYATSFNMPCASNSSICTNQWSFEQYLNTNSSKAILGRALDITSDGCYNGAYTTDFKTQSGCVALTFAIGNTSFVPINSTTVGQVRPQLRGFMCYQYLEEVQTMVNFNLPDLAINTVNPPEPIESTAKNLTFSSSIYNGPIYTNALNTLFDALDGVGIDIDPFMDAIIRGRDENTPVTAFLGSDGAELLRARATELHGIYMANAINSNFRIPLGDFDSQDSTQLIPSDVSTQATYQGILTQLDRRRLKQDASTKIALQIMLAIMTLLAITVFALTDRGLRLPMNPRSIAGTMMLLAGSEMASRHMIPPGSEWAQKRAKSNKIWEGYSFSLGWWSDANSHRRYGIDVGRARSKPVNASDRSSRQHADRSSVDHLMAEEHIMREAAVPPPPPPSAAKAPAALYQPRNQYEMEGINPTPMKTIPQVEIDVPSSGISWSTDDHRYSSYSYSHPHPQQRQSLLRRPDTQADDNDDDDDGDDDHHHYQETHQGSGFQHQRGQQEQSNLGQSESEDIGLVSTANMYDMDEASRHQFGMGVNTEYRSQGSMHHRHHHHYDHS